MTFLRRRLRKQKLIESSRSTPDRACISLQSLRSISEPKIRNLAIEASPRRRCNSMSSSQAVRSNRLKMQTDNRGRLALLQNRKICHLQTTQNPKKSNECYCPRTRSTYAHTQMTSSIKAGQLLKRGNRYHMPKVPRLNKSFRRCLATKTLKTKVEKRQFQTYRNLN